MTAASYTLAQLLAVELSELRDHDPALSGQATSIAITDPETGQVYATDLSPRDIQRLTELLAWARELQQADGSHSDGSWCPTCGKHADAVIL